MNCHQNKVFIQCKHVQTSISVSSVSHSSPSSIQLPVYDMYTIRPNALMSRKRFLIASRSRLREAVFCTNPSPNAAALFNRRFPFEVLHRVVWQGDARYHTVSYGLQSLLYRISYSVTKDNLAQVTNTVFKNSSLFVVSLLAKQMF